MNKKILMIVCTVLVLVGLGWLIQKRQTMNQAEFTIGILQTISHPALDQAREGFMQHLKQELGSKIAFVVQNAEGQVSNAQAIAKSFHIKKNISGIFAIATPAAQAIKHLEKIKPIFFAAISDPQAIGLIHPGTNACGATDLLDVKQQVAAIKTILPHVKRIAILFNPGEINSVSTVKKQEKALKDNAFEVIKIGVTSEAEVPIAVQRATRQAQAILIPTDNTLASAIQIVATTAQRAGVPVIVSDNLLVNKGVLFAAGAANYFVAGQKAAELAIEVLVNGKKPEDLALQSSIDNRIFINTRVAEALKIKISEDVLQKSVVVK